jgi:hypothetical protein
MLHGDGNGASRLATAGIAHVCKTRLGFPRCRITCYPQQVLLGGGIYTQVFGHAKLRNVSNSKSPGARRRNHQHVARLGGVCRRRRSVLRVTHPPPSDGECDVMNSA